MRPDLSAAPGVSIWTHLGPHPTSSCNQCPSPAARSGHAMTCLPPTRSVLLFGGADGAVFFDDIFLLEPTSSNISIGTFEGVSSQSTPRNDANVPQAAVQWKKLVVSRGTTFDSLSPCPLPFSDGPNRSASPSASDSGRETCQSTFIHAGGGRDYHSMHYVASSKDEESRRGFRVLVIGNVVVATDTTMPGRGTQAETGARKTGVAFDTRTLRVEELRVKQPILEAQWEPRRVDHTSMWKPRARHAHSSVVVGGDQVFVFGGKDATSTTFYNDLFYYEAALNQWVQPRVHPTGQKPQPRAFAGLTASHDGQILFLFGGTDGRQEFGSLFLYHVVHSRWDSLAGATMGDRPSCRINHSLTFVAPNHLVLFGGRRRAVRQNELFVYHVGQRTWRRVQRRQSEGTNDSHVGLDQTLPLGRTAHATVLLPSEPHAVQKLLVFGGYAGSHQWLDTLHLLSLPPSVLTLSSPSQSVARSTATRTLGTKSETIETLENDVKVAVNRGRSSLSKLNARVALSAPQQPLATHEASLSEDWHKQAMQDSNDIVTSQGCQVPEPLEPETESTGVNDVPSLSKSQTSGLLGPGQTSDNALRTLDTRQQPPAGSTVLTDITNQRISSSQQELVAAGKEAVAFCGVSKRYKRRRRAGASQESTSSHGNEELTTAYVGSQTMLLQLLQSQPRVEATLAHIVAMLTREQTGRQHQLKLLMRMHSKEQSKHLEAANRRNEALNERLARIEAERDSLQEKLWARETAMDFHPHGLETAIVPLKERLQAIETSHVQQLTVSQRIESKISAVHDFMEELRYAGEETDDSPPHRQEQIKSRETTELTPSQPRHRLYPQRVVVALKEKLRQMQVEKQGLEVQVKEMAEKVKVVEAREAHARQFLLSWCQEGIHSIASDATSGLSSKTSSSKSDS